MSERGVFAIDRGIWDDPDYPAEPFSEREAVMWLVGQAAWRATRVRVGTNAIEVERGQCAFSTRFMAAAWKWSEARVRRFLGRLEARGTICSESDARATRITLCNYDKFQRVSLPSDAPATQERRKEEDRETTSLRSVGEKRDRKRPKTSADPDWPLTTSLIEIAIAAGLSAERARAEWPNFISRALRDDARYSNWDQAWRNWCLSPYRQQSAQSPRSPPGQRVTGLAQLGQLKNFSRRSESQNGPTLDLEPQPSSDRAGRFAPDFPERQRDDRHDEQGPRRDGAGQVYDLPRSRAYG